MKNKREQIGFRVTPEMRLEIDRQLAARGLKLQDMIEEALRFYFETLPVVRAA